MFFLAASILSSTAIYVIFRLAKGYAVTLTPLITINYLAAGILGFAFLMQFDITPFLQKRDWLLPGAILGILFIIMFYLIGKSSQKAGITVTTLASKMSLVFPVMFSLYWFDEKITYTKYIGLIVAILAVLLTVYKKDDRKITPGAVTLPIIIFLGGGLIDSLIKFIQAFYLTENGTAAFSTFVFVIAFICGTVAVAYQSKKRWLQFNYPTLVFGILLGMANFGSLYFLILALAKSSLDSSFVFALNNMLIVTFSALTGMLIFKEQMNRINVAGLILALACLFIIL